ncbi:hypothetical protein MYU51_010817 [Penicillium brevicompactum]
MDTEMKDVQPLPLSPHLVTTLDRMERAFGHSRINEASARWIVNSVNFEAYEMTTSTIKNAQPLSVQCERGYRFGPVTLNHRKVVLSGRPDYSVWYGESESLCLNVLVVEAKGQIKGTNTISQLLACMGCIHQARKHEGKRNCGVYGMAYTGYSWHFLKISHESKWSELPVMGRRAHLEQPLGLLVWMFKRAVRPIQKKRQQKLRTRWCQMK